MFIGYARTSTIEQKAGFEAQLKELESVGCERENIFQEQVSSVGKRDELERAIGFARRGDVFVVTRLDRLARSITDLMVIIDKLQKKKVSVRILNLGVDTGTPTGKLILTVLGGIAQFEREIMLERQREGIAKAQAEGKYRGRKPLPLSKSQTALQLASAGVKPDSIADQLKIGVASVYRILARQKDPEKVEAFERLRAAWPKKGEAV